MEHLSVHLPDEAALGGPVQYRWMYPFERYMYHLKKKVKNKARIGGSIVAQCVQEEISYVATNYYENTELLRDSDYSGPGEIRFTYDADVPNIFYHSGRVTGKNTSGWFSDEDYNVLQTFLLLNCEEYAPYERMFEEQMTLSISDITSDAMINAKDNHYAQWCKDYINEASQNYEFPLWMLEFIQGLRRNFTSWPMYFTPGYHLHTQRHMQNKKTQNYGVCVRGTTDMNYYGLIEEIMKIEYHGVTGLKAMVFKCTWFDNTEGSGLRKHPCGVVDVASRKRYQKYDPFILPGHCDQVCFIPYPRAGRATNDWLACTKVVPRGYRETSENALLALQDDTIDHIVAPSAMVRVTTHVVEDPADFDNVYHYPLDEEQHSPNEFSENSDSSDDAEDV